MLRPRQAACKPQRTRKETGAPYGTRTRVSAVRGRRPGPLDEGSASIFWGGSFPGSCEAEPDGLQTTGNVARVRGVSSNQNQAAHALSANFLAAPRKAACESTLACAGKWYAQRDSNPCFRRERAAS